MRISDWSSDVCSSDLCHVCPHTVTFCSGLARRQYCFHIAINTNCNHAVSTTMVPNRGGCRMATALAYKQTHTERRIETRTPDRSEEHTSELQSLMRNSYAVLCLQKKKIYIIHKHIKSNKSNT